MSSDVVAPPNPPYRSPTDSRNETSRRHEGLYTNYSSLRASRILETSCYGNSFNARTSTTPSTSASGRTSDGTFAYRELGEKEFRLVRILPHKISTVKCEIIHANLEKHPKYIAISYAWGDATDIDKIELDGLTSRITLSLNGALKALRQKSEAVMVWADALWIDQQNEEEKTQQVQLMTSIYSKADAVAVWLGPDADEGESAVKLLDTLAGQRNPPERTKSLIASQSRKHDFAALVSLFERDYWKRLWVVQEVFNVRDITVFCGTMQHPWKLFPDACIAFRPHSGDLDLSFLLVLSDGERYTIPQDRLPYSQVLVSQGPGSFPNFRSLAELAKKRMKLEISAIYLGKIRRRGVAVGTLFALDDLLVAFLHWRAQLLNHYDSSQERNYDQGVHEQFCRKLSLDQTSSKWKEAHPQLDRDLRLYADARTVSPVSCRRIMQENCGDRMKGLYFLTDTDLLGMGSGFMAPGDLVVVPLACCSPNILRPQGGRGEYRFLGDIYIDRYMRGKAIDQLKTGRRELRKYVLI